MKKPAFRLSATAILEESVDLLRDSSPGVLVRFYLGAVPFALLAAAFVLDLSRQPAAGQRTAAWAFAMAVTYIWMKLWHAGFARGLRGQLGASEPPGEKGSWRRAASYIGWQGWAPWLLALAFIAALPFGWAFAFFHALAVTGESTSAWRQARNWPRQNHAVVGILSLLALVVAANLAGAILMLPGLLDSLFGIETAASQNPRSLLNSTLLVVSLAGTYLLLGPVAKAVYVLRAYYGDSRATGEDLKSRLGALKQLAAVLLAVVAWTSMGAAVEAQTAAGQPESTALDRALDNELAGSDYDWLRLDELAPVPEGAIARFFNRVAEAFTSAVDWLAEAIGSVIDWLRGDPARSARQRQSGGLSPINPRSVILLASLLVVAALIYILTRRDSEPPVEEMEPLDAEGLAAALEGDDSAADRMPFDEWLEQARQLLAAGDNRLAARAAYLATLSFLAHSQLLLLAQHKSNLDYRRELALKSRRWPAMLPTFVDSVKVVERVWYGRHPAGGGEFDRLTANLHAMRTSHESA